MLLSTLGRSGYWGLLAAVGLHLTLSSSAPAQSARRYVFPATRTCGLQPLPTGEVLMASLPTNTRLLRLHWLDTQGDTVRSRRTMLPGAGSYLLATTTLNPATGTVLLVLRAGSTGRIVLLSPQGDTLWTRPAGWIHQRFRPLPTADGGFVYLVEGSVSNSANPPAWVRISAAGHEVGRVSMPVASTGYSLGTGLLPASGGGYWVLLYDSQVNGGPYTGVRAQFVSEAGVLSGPAQPLPGVSYVALAAALPNPADGYVLATSQGMQRFSPTFQPQWPTAVPGTRLLNYYGLRVAADGTTLTYGGPYVTNGFEMPPASYPVQARVISPLGRILQDTVLDRTTNSRAGFGLDIAKTGSGRLVYAAEIEGSSVYTTELRVYVTQAALPTAATGASQLITGLYPLPATTHVTFQPPLPLLSPARLYDLQGRCIRRFSLRPNGQPTTLDLTGLAAGLYVLRATTAEGRPVAARLSKQ